MYSYIHQAHAISVYTSTGNHPTDITSTSGFSNLWCFQWVSLAKGYNADTFALVLVKYLNIILQFMSGIRQDKDTST